MKRIFFVLVLRRANLILPLQQEANALTKQNNVYKSVQFSQEAVQEISRDFQHPEGPVPSGLHSILMILSQFSAERKSLTTS